MKNKNSRKKSFVKKIIQEINKKLEKFNEEQKKQIVKKFLAQHNISDKLKRLLLTLSNGNYINNNKNNIKTDVDKKPQLFDFVKKYYDGLPSNDEYKFNPTDLDKTVIFNVAGNKRDDKKSKTSIKNNLFETIKKIDKNKHSTMYEFVENKKRKKKIKSSVNQHSIIGDDVMLLEMEQNMKRNTDKTKVKGTFVNPGKHHLWLQYGKGEKIHTPMPTIKEENEEFYNSTISSSENCKAKNKKEKINNIKKNKIIKNNF